MRAITLVFFLLTGTANAESKLIATYDQGFLEEVNGLPVLHVKGSPKRMGKQYGYLAGDRVRKMIDLVNKIAKDTKEFSAVPAWMVSPLRAVIGWTFWQQYPKETRKMMIGMVEGAQLRDPPIYLELSEIAFINAVIDLVGILRDSTRVLEGDSEESVANTMLSVLGLQSLRANCNSFAAWGSRTVDGKTFQTRNVDIPVGMGFESYPLIVVQKPTNRMPFVSATFAGLVGVFTGMNASGVGMGQIWANSQARAVGIPWQIQMRKVLSEARDSNEAVELFRISGQKTYGNNFVFADAEGNGYAVETTPHDYEVFTDDDPREEQAIFGGESFAIQMKDAVFRADTAMSPRIRSYQTAARGPDGDPRLSNVYKKRYKGQADRIQEYADQGILIGKEQAEEISRQTAMRNESIQAAVYANTDREIWVSYATIESDGSVKQAYQNEYRHFPFNKYVPQLVYVDGRVYVRAMGMDIQGRQLRVRVTRGERQFEYLHRSRLKAGDVLELRSKNGLIDRLII